MAAPGVDWASIEQQAIQEAMPYLMALIGLAGASLIAFATIVLNRLKNKMAAEEAVSKDALMKSKADQGVQKAKEMSAVQFKATGIPLTGEQKNAIATDMVVASVPDATPADVKDTVVAAVGAAIGEGASGKEGELQKTGISILDFVSRDPNRISRPPMVGGSGTPEVKP